VTARDLRAWVETHQKVLAANDCLAAVSRDGTVLQIIPKRMRSLPVCLEAARNDPNAIKHIPKGLLTEKLALQAATVDSYAFNWLPSQFHTVRFFRKAVKRNGLVIKRPPYVALPEDIYAEAMAQNAAALEYVPNQFKSPEMCSNAVERDGLLLEFVPNRLKSAKRCLAAVQHDGLALHFVPTQLRSDAVVACAVANDAMALQYVPQEQLTKALCDTAVTGNPLALEFVPHPLKTAELCARAVAADWKAYRFLPAKLYSAEGCLEVLERVLSKYADPKEESPKDYREIRAIIEQLPDNVAHDRRIIVLARKLELRQVTTKSYSSATGLFSVVERLGYQDDEVSQFKAFADFYDYADADMTDANLLEFDFDGIDLSSFNLEGAYISSDILLAHGLYDDSFYARTIRDCSSDVELMLSSANELVAAGPMLHDIEMFLADTSDDQFFKVYYISDIHLNHKLMAAFPSHATEAEIKLYIRDLVRKMVDTAKGRTRESYLLIAGDVSFSFEISTLFYTELARQWSSSNSDELDIPLLDQPLKPPRSSIVVVLGNHELWDFNRSGRAQAEPVSLEQIIQRYRDMFNELGIRFLHNELLVTGRRIVREEKLESIDTQELQDLCLRSPLVILGGLGFSALDQRFNATNGIYRQTITSLDQDIEQTQRFETVYTRVAEAFGQGRVVVLTHTPKADWSADSYNPNWIYVSGHTHRNEFWQDDEKTVYSDNQIGYHSTSVGLKSFNLTSIYDIFRYFSDGKHAISRDQYLEFNRGMRISMTFNRDGRIHMLKKAGVYCFIYESMPTANLFLLNGGRLNKLTHNLDYYYEGMAQYAAMINQLLQGYKQAQTAISACVKAIGGKGTIHGCIVDIDFYNHVYIDPVDGKVTPYFAWSMAAKYAYPSLQSLFQNERPDLLNNYLKLLEQGGDGPLMLEGRMPAGNMEVAQFVSDTSMYRPSRLMRSLQYLTDLNILRVWDDRVMAYQPQATEEIANERRELTAG